MASPWPAPSYIPRDRDVVSRWRYEHADDLRDALAPGCERIAITGQMRRLVYRPSRIDLLVVPNLQGNLFGEGLCTFEGVLLAALRDGKIAADSDISLRATGEMVFALPYLDFTTFRLHLHLAEHGNWGLRLMETTGPPEFSDALRTPIERGGLAPDGVTVVDGWVHVGGVRIKTPTEDRVRDVYEMIELPPPHERVWVMSGEECADA